MNSKETVKEAPPRGQPRENAQRILRKKQEREFISIESRKLDEESKTLEALRKRHSN
jgi:hypothetical protein